MIIAPIAVQRQALLAERLRSRRDSKRRSRLPPPPKCQVGLARYGRTGTGWLLRQLAEAAGLTIDDPTHP